MLNVPKCLKDHHPKWYPKINCKEFRSLDVFKNRFSSKNRRVKLNCLFQFEESPHSSACLFQWFWVVSSYLLELLLASNPYTQQSIYLKYKLLYDSGTHELVIFQINIVCADILLIPTKICISFSEIVNQWEYWSSND